MTVDILILGLGFVGDYLSQLCTSRNITYAATTTTGRNNTIPFKFDPSMSDSEAMTLFSTLPTASCVVVTFPVTGTDAATNLIRLYTQTHPQTTSDTLRWILLGSTRAWAHPSIPNTSPPSSVWLDRNYTVNPITDPRLAAESVFLSYGGVVLNLAGLWGGNRQPWNWVSRIITSKQDLATKTSLHLIHGMDVARIILAMGVDEVAFKDGGVRSRYTAGERWIVTDMHVYDWWSLILSWGSTTTTTDQAKWVMELLSEHNVRGLPRSPESLGRALDAREIWSHLQIGGPIHTLVTKTIPEELQKHVL